MDVQPSMKTYMHVRRVISTFSPFIFDICVLLHACGRLSMSIIGCGWQGEALRDANGGGKIATVNRNVV